MDRHNAVDEPEDQASVDQTIGYPDVNQQPDQHEATLPPIGSHGSGRRRVTLLAVCAAMAVIIAAAMTAWAITSQPAEPSTVPAPPGPTGTTIRSVLHTQDLALLRGDETAYLATVDPSQPDLVARYRARYAALRGLKVTAWRQDTLNGAAIVDASRPIGPVKVRVHYCLAGIGDCDPNRDDTAPTLEEDVGLGVHNGRTAIDYLVAPPTVAVAANAAKRVPTPWQTGPLTIATGRRVIVAAPADLAGQVAAVLPVAEQAAVAADGFARFTARPPYYLLYLAGTSQWNLWYGGRPDRGDALGYAIATGGNLLEIVLDLSHINSAELPVVIQHEMGHVVTLRSAKTNRDLAQAYTADWIAEGAAEYVAWAGRDPTGYYRLGDVRRYLRSGGLRSGDFTGAIHGGDTLTNSAGYGMAYLALRHLADRYSEQTMLTFVNAVLRQAQTQHDAAQATFGQPWDALSADCTQYIRAIGR